MTTPRPSAFLAACTVSLVLQVPASAQLGTDLGTLVTNSLTAMEQQRWDEAHAMLQEAVDRFGRNQPLVLFGPRFGTIYYRKGVCEMNLGRHEDAMNSFEICYRDFPNAGDNVAGGGNTYRTRALLRWGEAAMGVSEWQVALERFEQFLNEREATDRFSAGQLMLNMATCHYRLGAFDPGHQLLDQAIEGQARLGVPPDAIFSVFLIFAEMAVQDQNEDGLLAFIESRRPHLILPPHLAQRFSDRLLVLSGSSLGGDMFRSALVLNQLLPATSAALDGLRVQIALLGDRAGLREGTLMLDKARLEAELAALGRKVETGRSAEVYRLSTSAIIHERMGNARGAFVAYEEIETFHRRSPDRENHLFNLVRTSSLIGRAVSTARYGNTFLNDFPESAYVAAVKRMMLASLFYEGRYRECADIAKDLIGSLEPGTPEHEICVHVLGGSYYYLNENEEAVELLDQYLELYPEGQYLVAATYFQAANLSRLNQWAASGVKLDAFLDRFPDAAENPFKSFALYDRATCHFALNENEAASAVLAPIFTEHRDSAILDAAYNLKGNLEQAAGELEEAETSYLAALEIAERRYNRVVASEALSALVGLLGDPKEAEEDPERFDRAVAFADKFWAEHGSDSPYTAQVAVAQVPPLRAAGRGEEALERLRALIATSFESGDVFGVEALLNSYTEVYLESHTPDELKEHYYSFEGVSISNHAARALLRVALIGIFEKMAKDAETDDARLTAEASVNVLFNELRRDFAPADLTNFILVRVADFIRTGTSSPAEALPFYDELISRRDASYRFEALLGRGETLLLAGSPADLERATTDFERVLTESDVRAQRESALYQTVIAWNRRGDHAKAVATARRYLGGEEGNFSRHTAEVNLLMARSLNAQGQTDAALTAYLTAFTNPGFITVAAPAVKEWMEIVWRRNRGNDRQNAHDQGASFVSAVGRLADRMTPEDLALFEEVRRLTETYGADPSIITTGRR